MGYNSKKLDSLDKFLSSECKVESIAPEWGHVLPFHKSESQRDSHIPIERPLDTTFRHFHSQCIDLKTLILHMYKWKEDIKLVETTVLNAMVEY